MILEVKFKSGVPKGVDFFTPRPKISGLNPMSFDPPRKWQNCRIKPMSLPPRNFGQPPPRRPPLEPKSLGTPEFKCAR